MVLVCAGLPACQHKQIMLTRNGHTEYTVIQSDKATEPEKFAVEELTHFLGRVTGAAFPVMSESSFSGEGPGIYVGWTDYTVENGIGSDTLGEEEWVIRTIGKDLVITGGRPRGTLFGIYEFLERQVECHWLDQYTEVIPSKPTLALGELDIQNKPWFWVRWLSSSGGKQDNHWKFLTRNKNYDYRFKRSTCKDYKPEGAFYQLYGYPRKTHSFSFFVNAADWFESHSEYFSLNRQGERVPDYDSHGPGQLCLTNPDVRRLTLESLRKFIVSDRQGAADAGCLPPRIYMINQEDLGDAHCQCKDCQKIAMREGSESGPLIDFINAIAEGIEKDYPDIIIQTIAYNQTSIPPKSIRPRNNVLIAWCDVYSRCDGIRPLEDPLNSRNYNEITEWGKLAPRLGIGDD